METDKDKIEDISGNDGFYKAGEPAGEEHGTDKPRRRVIFRVFALAGLVCAIAGWLLLYHAPEAALAVSGAGVCASVAGLWSGRGCIRSLSVTGLVTAGVLILVYVAFYWGLAWGVSHF